MFRPLVSRIGELTEYSSVSGTVSYELAPVVDATDAADDGRRSFRLGVASGERRSCRSCLRSDM